VGALREDRFAYAGPSPGLARSLQVAYVTRGRWGKILPAAIAVVFAAATVAAVFAALARLRVEEIASGEPLRCLDDVDRQVAELLEVRRAAESLAAELASAERALGAAEAERGSNRSSPRRRGQRIPRRCKRKRRSRGTKGTARSSPPRSERTQSPIMRRKKRPLAKRAESPRPSRGRFAASEDEHSKRCTELLVQALDRADMHELRKKAARTPTEEDDRLIAELERLEQGRARRQQELIRLRRLHQTHPERAGARGRSPPVQAEPIRRRALGVPERAPPRSFARTVRDRLGRRRRAVGRHCAAAAADRCAGPRLRQRVARTLGDLFDFD